MCTVSKMLVYILYTGREVCAECCEENKVNVSHYHHYIEPVASPPCPLPAPSLHLSLPPSELEEALLVMPFSDVTLFLPLLSSWLEVRGHIRLPVATSVCFLSEWLGDRAYLSLPPLSLAVIYCMSLSHTHSIYLYLECTITR